MIFVCFGLELPTLFLFLVNVVKTRRFQSLRQKMSIPKMI